MKNVLIIKSSVLDKGSHSSDLADYFAERIMVENSTLKVSHLDVNQAELPQLDAAMVAAMFAAEPTEQQYATKKISENLIEQLFTTDTLLIATPMYNFAIPSKLKNYIDLVARPGKTFSYQENGPVGHLGHLNVIVVMASGGDYTQAPLNQMDQITPYLTTLFNFLGVKSIRFVYAPGMAMQEAEQHKEKAREALAELAGNSGAEESLSHE